MPRRSVGPLRLSWPSLATRLHAKSFNPDGRSGGLLRAETGASLATRLLAAIVASVGPRLLANTPPALFQVLWRRLRVRTFGSEEAQAVPKSNIHTIRGLEDHMRPGEAAVRCQAQRSYRCNLTLPSQAKGLPSCE